MFRLMLREGKRRPDYSGSDENLVLLCLHGEIQDPNYVTFLAKVERQQQGSLDLYDLLLLDDIRQGKVHRADDRVRRFLRLGVIEKVGRARATCYILSKHGESVPEQAPDRQARKTVLLSFLEQNERKGSLYEFQELLLDLSRKQIHSLLNELREEGKVVFVGPRRTGHWEMT
jgi:hypothetical protein